MAHIKNIRSKRGVADKSLNLPDREIIVLREINDCSEKLFIRDIFAKMAKYATT